MSIDYYGLPVRDAKRIGGIVEGEDVANPIDQAAVRAALKQWDLLEGGDTGTLKWEAGNDYVFADVMPNHVHVAHNTGRSSAQIEVVMAVVERLQTCGLFVYDPQQGSWFPGS